jgi:hypothetical protein
MQRRVLKESLAGMPCKSCGSVNQKKFSAKKGIHFSELKEIDKPCGYFLRLLSAWIVAPRNLPFRKKSCASSQRETPPQVNLELSLTSH